MRTIEILEREHEWISWMAESLESMVAQCQTEGLLPEPAYELLELYAAFADGRHQDKEEQILFPELLAAADERTHDMLRQLLADHETERRYLAEMRVSVLGAVHGEPGCVREFVNGARNYLDLHHAHMARESEILFPLAERLLSPDADARCVQSFETIEGGREDPHALREQILSLRVRAGLPRPPAA